MSSATWCSVAQRPETGHKGSRTLGQNVLERQVPLAPPAEVDLMQYHPEDGSLTDDRHRDRRASTGLGVPGVALPGLTVGAFAPMKRRRERAVDPGHASAVLWVSFVVVACRSPVEAHRAESDRGRDAYTASVIEAAASIQRPQTLSADPGRFELSRDEAHHRDTLALSIVLARTMSVTVWARSDAPDAVTVAILSEAAGRRPTECLSLAALADHEPLDVPAFERIPPERDAADAGVVTARLPVATLERMAAASTLRLGRCGSEVDVDATQRSTLREFLRRLRALARPASEGAR